jgi:hypothetical protein
MLNTVWPRPISLSTLLGLLAVIGGCNNPPTRPHGLNDVALSESQYEHIQSLAGEWHLVGGSQLGNEIEADTNRAFITYEVSSAGNSVIEKLFVGQEGEMTTVYHMEDGQLVMVHYCSLGNQPYMVAVPSENADIVFELVRVGNMKSKNDLHISSHSMEFHSDDEMTQHWGSTKDQQATESMGFKVKRLR